MEQLWDILFQLMKHGTNTLHAAFIFLFSLIIDGLWVIGLLVRWHDPSEQVQ
jgi:hypothetical protein